MLTPFGVGFYLFDCGVFGDTYGVNEARSALFICLCFTNDNPIIADYTITNKTT